jgi:hypothetical protein
VSRILGCLLALTLMATSEAPAQSLNPRLGEEDASELIGGPVLSADGEEVGEVAAVTLEPDGEVSEIRIATGALLGLGEVTVVLPQGSYITLRGALVLRLSAAQVRQLPRRVGA